MARVSDRAGSDVARLVRALVKEDASIRVARSGGVRVLWPSKTSAKLSQGGMGEVVIDFLHTEASARGSGSATSAMRAMMAAATGAGLCLLVEPMQSDFSKGALTSEDLAAWYARLGFYFVD